MLCAMSGVYLPGKHYLHTWRCPLHLQFRVVGVIRVAEMIGVRRVYGVFTCLFVEVTPIVFVTNPVCACGCIPGGAY